MRQEFIRYPGEAHQLGDGCEPPESSDAARDVRDGERLPAAHPHQGPHLVQLQPLQDQVHHIRREILHALAFVFNSLVRRSGADE